MNTFYELSYYQKGKKHKHIVPDDDYLGSGMEVNVYKVKNKVVKLYKNYCKKIRLTKEDCDRLTKIKTKRILLPTTTLEDKKGNMIGYKMKYISDLGKDSFFKLNKENLTKELELLEEDINILSDNSIHIRDLGYMNTVYHNGLYLIDSGSYDILKQSSKYKDMAYRMNQDEIDEYLIGLIENYANDKYKDTSKIALMIKNIRKKIYSNNLRPLKYFKNYLEEDNIDELIEKEMDKQNYKVSIDGKEISLDRNYQRIFFDDKKDIYYDKNDETKLIIYKTRKPALKLTQKELNNLSNIDTKRIITPVGRVEVLDSNKIAYQVDASRDFKYSVSGKDMLEEFKLLKQDAEKLGEAGIYIGNITTEDILYDDSLHIDKIEMMEMSENAKDENIEALNVFIKSIFIDVLFDITSTRNVCQVLNSINNENIYYIGDILEKDFDSDEEFTDCVRKMVKTRTNNL